MNVVESIKNAGVVGLGGAGFPTHIKLLKKPETLIVNCAECEPLLRNDRYIMRHFADKLVNAIEALNAHFGGINCVFATKADYREEISALEKAIADKDSSAEIHLLKGYYPVGDEQMTVYEVTGRTVPPAGLPADIGCTVINAATLYSVDNALSGLPLIKKFVTVTGEVKNPSVIRVPVGTSFSDCVKLAGGALTEDYTVVSGGPMMGTRMSKEEAQGECVLKTTSGIIILPREGVISRLAEADIRHIRNRAASSCIQCSYCTEYCPRHLVGHPLEPHKIMRRLAYAPDISTLLDDGKIKEAALCCECGICELYACPMGLQPRAVNSLIKQMLKERGVCYEKGKGLSAPDDFREGRLVPTMRAAARAGVSEYYNAVSAESFIDYTPRKVALYLKQGAGAAAKPVTAAGDRVKAGELIAKCPENALGSDLHASIDGTVKVYADRITIEG